MRMQGGNSSSKSKSESPVISRPIGESDEPLREMLYGQGEAQQGTKTLEIIDGVPNFYLVIPCSVEKPDRIQPERLIGACTCGNSNCMAESVRYKCRGCGKIFKRYKSWMGHIGRHKIVLTACPGE